YPYSNETKQPVTGTIPTTGCLKGVLIPVSKTGVSPYHPKAFYLYRTPHNVSKRLTFPFPVAGRI
ncbi:hypothetical protein U8V97_18420, partial [Priestia filamentosa]|uniref:hypothetical protein n=1 Tax=Priestia filamentosa TaxID=1402861 RepID=UPI003979D2F3